MEINGIGNVNYSEYTKDIFKEETDFKEKLEKAKNLNDKELKKACNEMEAYFINYLFKIMRSSINREGSYIKQSFAQETFEDMLYDEVSKSYSKAGGIGLSDMLYRQMSKVDVKL